MLKYNKWLGGSIKYVQTTLVTLAIVVGAMTMSSCGSVEMVVEDRSGAHIELDSKIIVGLKNDINNQMGTGKAFSITNDVYEQTVMLTGIVETSNMRAQAGDIANAHPGVKQVINELQVIPTIEQKSVEDEGYIDDIVVNTKFYGKMVSTAGVSHTNWRYNSVNGVMYLFGRALSQAEMNKVISIAKNTENVRKVVNHAIVKPL